MPSPLAVEGLAPEPAPEPEPKTTPARHVTDACKLPPVHSPAPSFAARAVVPVEVVPQGAMPATVGQTSPVDPNGHRDGLDIDGGLFRGSASGGGEGHSGDSLAVGPSYDAAYLNNAPPKYPPVARRMKLQGTTTVRVLVGTDGRPRRVSLADTSGVDLLDEAALEAVQGWTFVPAREGTSVIAAEVDVPLRFRLEGTGR